MEGLNYSMILFFLNMKNQEFLNFWKQLFIVEYFKKKISLERPT